MNRHVIFVLLGLYFLVAGHAASGQSASDYSMTEFKLTNSSDDLPVYTGMSTTPIYNLSFKVTRPTTANIFTPSIYLVGYIPSGGGANAFDTQIEATINYPSSVNNNNGTVTDQYTGTIRLRTSDANNIASGAHTGLQAVIVFPGTGGPGVGSNIIKFTHPAQAGAVTVTSLRANGSTSIELSGTATNVTYTLTLSKDRGFSDGINTYLRGSTASGALSALIQASNIQAPNTTVSPGSSNGWIERGTKLEYTVKKTVALISTDVGVNDDRLVAQAFGENNPNTPLGTNVTNSTNGPVLITHPTVKCNDDVLLQNTSTLTGTVTSGHNLLAGSNVNLNATQGGVVVPTNTTVAFAAQNEIQLTADFSVQLGALFSAYIDGSVCSVVRFANDPAPTSSIAVADASLTTTQQEAKPLNMQGTDARAELLTLYPNPALTSLTVGLPMTSAAPRQAIIYNNSGTEVLRVNLPGLQNTLDVHSLPAGLYQLRTTYQGQNIMSRFSIGY